MALPSDVQALLDALEPAIREAFIEAIERITSQAQLTTIVGHIQNGNIEAAIIALRIDPVFFQPMDRAIVDAFYRGGVLAMAGLPAIADPFPVAERFLASMDAILALNSGDDNTSED